MASLTKVLLLGSTSESGGTWSSVLGANSTASFGVVDTDTVAGHTSSIAGQLSVTGKNKSNANTLRWTGTWENLGIPVGSTVTAVQVITDWKCSTFTTGAASSGGIHTITDNAGTNSINLDSATSAYSALFAWVTRTGLASVAVPSAIQPSNSTIRLNLNTTMATGSSNSAVNTLHFTYVQVVITYSFPASKTQTATARVASTATKTQAAKATIAPNPNPWVRENLQMSASYAAGTSHATSALTAGASAGNTLILSGTENALLSNALSSVTDSKGNTWTIAAQSSTNTHTFQAFTQQDVGTLTTSDTITLHWTSSISPIINVIVEEFTGLAASPLDQTSTGNWASGTTRSAGTTAATTQAKELIVAAFGLGNQETTFVAGSGYLGFPSIPGSTLGGSIEGEWTTVTATGTQSPTATGNNNTGDGVVGTYKLSVPVFTKTQTAIARIQVTGTKTQTSLARVQATPTKTQSAIARIQTAGTKTQTATARIQNTAVTKTQASTARIQKVLTKTQSAIARIGLLGTKTQPAIARVQSSPTKTQGSLARIQNTAVVKTQGAVARVQNTALSKTQSAIARISKGFTKTQPATARIQVTATKTQPSIARIQITGSKTQPAHAWIQIIGTKTQPSTARILNTAVSKTQTSTARIQVAGTKTQPATARIQKVLTKTQSAIARIQKAFIKTQPATARVQVTGTKTQPSVARVQNTAVTKTQTAIARIGAIGGFSKNQTATARIQVVGLTKTQGAIARIAKLLSRPQTALARIQASSTKTQPAIARIAKVLSKAQNAVARIQRTLARTQPATARIQATPSQAQPATARIQSTGSSTQPAIARIQIVSAKTQPATARLSATLSATQTATAHIGTIPQDAGTILVSTKATALILPIHQPVAAAVSSVTPELANLKVVMASSTITPKVGSTGLILARDFEAPA